MPEKERLPRGLVFFPPDAPDAYRRRRMLFVLVIGLTIAMTMWPLYPLFSSVYPLILGLPFSFAWIILWLAVSMASLIGLFKSEAN